jgi:hypothetical protein
MKTIPTLRNRKLLATALVVWGLGSVLNAAEPTAFELIKEGNRHVGEDAKDRVVQIRSEKSVGTLTPNIWYMVFYDPDATAKAAEVKFGAGKKLSVKRPARILEPITGQHKQLNREKMKIDSDKAIEIVKKEPLLDKLTLTATQLWLERRAWHSDGYADLESAGVGGQIEKAYSYGGYWRYLHFGRRWQSGEERLAY